MKKILIVIGILVVILCCCTTAAATIYFGPQAFKKVNSYYINNNPTPTSIYSEGIPTDSGSGSGSESAGNPSSDFTSPQVVENPVSPGALETLNTEENNIIPINEMRSLADRLKGIKGIPEVLPNPPKNYNIGDSDTFWVSEDSTHKNFQVTAILRYKGDHLYFWVDQQSTFDQRTLDALAKTFDQQIYPTDRAFFGSEWNPGIDNDPRLYILYVHGVGGRIAGYFSSTDEINPLAHPYSNAHEMFIINSDSTGLGEEFTYGVMAHEFQHMIEWNRHRNEDAWLNEGFSELAAFLNHYDIGGFDSSFITDPDLQLDDWPNNPDATSPHYGAGFLFTDYFLNRFGEAATQAVIGEEINGLDSVDKALQDLSIKDSQNGQPLTADDVFADWAATNYLLNPKAGDGRYQYKNYPNAPKATATTTISNCPSSIEDANVHQYGTDYIQINCSGNYHLTFQGSTQTVLLPTNPHSGDYAFWSNKGDESDMTLTHSFDLSGVTGNVSIEYWTWYDTEKDFDYVYLEASEDGIDWKILNTPSGTDKNPSGNSYGWGYNGPSNSWLDEKVDLSAYAGKQIQLRFEYVTDAAVNGEGFLLDDVSIPALNYATDFESDDGGWEGKGFTRIQNHIPQKYLVSIIKEGHGNPTVERIQLDSMDSAKIPLNFENGIQKITVVVSGATRYTRALAPYTIKIDN